MGQSSEMIPTQNEKGSESMVLKVTFFLEMIVSRAWTHHDLKGCWHFVDMRHSVMPAYVYSRQCNTYRSCGLLGRVARISRIDDYRAPGARRIDKETKICVQVCVLFLALCKSLAVPSRLREGARDLGVPT
eukprot:scaffold306450_cov16-Prasinocladus_malaysianus.AAC.1